MCLYFLFSGHNLSRPSGTCPVFTGWNLAPDSYRGIPVCDVLVMP
jgi:hypothetical protein